MGWISRWVLALVPLALAGSALAAGSAPPGALFPEDARLSRPVTVNRPRGYLGELAEILAQQGHVSLRVDDAKGAVSGIDLTVILTERPLREVMTGLATELTTRSDPWEWQRSGSGYVLRHQQSPEAASAAARREILEKWTADVRELYRIATLPDQERQERAGSHPSLMAKELDPRVLGNLDLLGRLTPEQVRVLAQGREVPLDTGRLTERQRTALRLGISSGIRTGDPQPPPPPPAFHVTWDSMYLSPVLWLRGTDGGSGNVCGGNGWDNQWLQDHADGWTGPGDPGVVEQLMQQVRGDQSLGRSLPSGAYHLWFRRAAERHHLNVIADMVYPRGEETISGWLGTTPERTFRYMVPFGKVVWRRVGELHLVRHKTAGLDPRRHLVPWPEIRALRLAAQKDEGFLGLAQFHRLSRMTAEQLRGLKEEFPDADPACANPLPLWFPILQFFGSLDPQTAQRALRPEGLRYADTGLVARGALENPPVGAGGKEDLRGLELLRRHPNEAVVSLHTEPVMALAGKPARRLVWEVRVPGEAPWVRQYLSRPRRPLAAEPPDTDGTGTTPER